MINPIFTRGTNEVTYFAPDGADWTMMVSTYQGTVGHLCTTNRRTLEDRPITTLFVSIQSTLEGQPLEFTSGVVMRSRQKVMERLGLLEPVDHYGESLHAVCTLEAKRGTHLYIAG